MSFPAFNDLSAFSANQAMEIEQFISYLTGYLSTQHKDDGSHSAITADSLVVAGPISGTTGTFSGDVIADSGTTPITLGSKVGQPGGNVGRIGPGLDINGLSANGGRWTWVGEDTGLTRTFYLLDRKGGSDCPFAVEIYGGNYYVKPNPVTNGLTPCNLGDPGDALNAGMWSTIYGQIIKAATAYFERGRTTALGEWTAVTYASGNFTADTGTWTVEAGDQITLAYTMVGKTMHLIWVIKTSTTASAPNELRIAIPGGFTAARETRLPCLVLLAAGNSTGMALVTASGTVVRIFRDSAGTAYPNETNTVSTYGEMTFEVQ